jgi:pimeloyl-ACP methyl ester carboxylesterase
MSLEAFVAATRSALIAAGLERRELEGNVYFAGRAEARHTLVLIHGANDQAGTWASVVPLLPQYRLIVPDLAGHGESAPATGSIPIPLIVDQLNAIIENECRTGFSPCLTLVGNSMGAWIALLYALRHPERVERLVLESGGGLALPLAVPLTATNRNDAMVILRAVHGPNALLPEWAIDALIARALGSPMLRLTQPEFLDTRLGEVKTPTTLLWGANDGVIPRSYMEALHVGIAGARLQVIEDAAHIPHAQQPARFVSCLTATS